MLKKRKIIQVLLTASIYCIGCSKASEDKLGGQNASMCDTTIINYSSVVLPVISANCYSCHDSREAMGGITLDSYISIKMQVINGNLAGAVTHAAGYTPMPYQQPKLSGCDIVKIIKWINSGSPEN
jgi:hypothetical protein